MTKALRKIATDELQNNSMTDAEIAFTKRTIRMNAIVSPFKKEGHDLAEAEGESEDGMAALRANGGLQQMLAAQMLSIHQLQQLSMGMAGRKAHTEAGQFFTNTSIKLANVFVQQASLLSKLQGNAGHQIVVERVDVHNGAQAVVGSVIGAAPTHGSKK